MRVTEIRARKGYDFGGESPRVELKGVLDSHKPRGS